PAVADDGFWQTADPTTVGVDADALERHRALCEQSGADACVVVRRGKIVQEWYSPQFHKPAMAMSSTKSVTGLLVGMLLDEGKIPIWTPADVCGGRRVGDRQGSLRRRSAPRRHAGNYLGVQQRGRATPLAHSGQSRRGADSGLRAQASVRAPGDARNAPP